MLERIRHLDELNAKREAYAREHLEELSLEKGEFVGRVQLAQRLSKLDIVPRTELLRLSTPELKDYAAQLEEMLATPSNGKQ